MWLWHRLEDVHLAVFLLSFALPGSVVFSIAKWANGLPSAWALALGATAGITVAAGWRIARRRYASGDITTPTSVVSEGTAAPRPRENAAAADTIHRQRDVYLHELIVDKWRIRGHIFEDCNIIGPAVVSYLRCTFQGCSYVANDAESLVIFVDEPRHYEGTLLIKDCIFKRCTFRMISQIGTAPDVAKDVETRA